jgi:hypothetical protein
MLKTFGHLQKNDYLCIIKNKNNNLKIRAMKRFEDYEKAYNKCYELLQKTHSIDKRDRWQPHYRDKIYLY